METPEAIYKRMYRRMAERMGYNVIHAISYDTPNLAYEFARLAFRYAAKAID